MSRISLRITEEERIHLTVGEFYDIGKNTQEREVTPTEEEQVVLPDDGYLLSRVTVNPIPSNYGLITWDGSVLTVS